MRFMEHKTQYYETDQMGIIHHSNYIRWFEEARVHMMEQLGMGYDAMEEAGVISPVISIHCEYKSMTRFGETVRIITNLKEYNGIKMTIEYTVLDCRTGQVRLCGREPPLLPDQRRKAGFLKRNYIEMDKAFRNSRKRMRRMKMLDMEFRILYWLQELRSPVLDQAMEAITHLGDKAGFSFSLERRFFHSQNPQSRNSSAFVPALRDDCGKSVPEKSGYAAQAMLDRRVGAVADSGSSRLFLSIRPYPGRFRDRCKHFSGQSEVGNRFSDFRRPHRTFQNVPVCTFSYRCVKRSGPGNFYCMVCQERD